MQYGDIPQLEKELKQEDTADQATAVSYDWVGVGGWVERGGGEGGRRVGA